MTEQAWAEWKQHPVTVLLFRYLEKERQRVIDGWTGGIYEGRSGDETLQVNAKAIGAVQCLDALLKIEEDDLEQ